VTTTAQRRTRVVAVLVGVLVAAGWSAAGIADAAISPFTLSPAAGPAGTVVHVSGAGCSPGLTVSAANDYVAVTAPVLGVSMRVPAAANGSWNGSFAVPANATPIPAGLPVAALCVSDGLPSLTTLYTPQTFTVTAPPTTTTPTTPTTPTSPTTPTTKPTTGSTPPTNGGGPGSGNGGGPGSTVPVFGGCPPDPSGGNSGGGSGNAGSEPGESRPGPKSTVKIGDSKAARAARAADLSVPELPAARVTGAGGLGWLSWLLLIGLLVAAVAAPFWLRRSRRPDDDAAAIGDHA
jgi:hypothetical protein